MNCWYSSSKLCFLWCSGWFRIYLQILSTLDFETEKAEADCCHLNSPFTKLFSLINFSKLWDFTKQERLWYLYHCHSYVANVSDCQGHTKVIPPAWAEVWRRDGCCLLGFLVLLVGDICTLPCVRATSDAVKPNQSLMLHQHIATKIS